MSRKNVTQNATAGSIAATPLDIAKSPSFAYITNIPFSKGWAGGGNTTSKKKSSENKGSIRHTHNILPTLMKSMNSTFWPPDSSLRRVGDTVIPSATGGGLALGLGPDRRGLPVSLLWVDGDDSVDWTLSGFTSSSNDARPLGDSWAGGVRARLRKSAASCVRPSTSSTSGGVF